MIIRLKPVGPLAIASAAVLVASVSAGQAAAQAWAGSGRYVPPPPPVEAWGAPAWGRPYGAGYWGAGNWSHVTGYSYGYSGVGYPYAPVETYGGHPAYGGAWPYDWRRQDRGGRYGYSVRHDEERPRGYRDRWGYNDDRPPAARRHDHGEARYRRRDDCDCRDLYLYDR